MKTTQHYEAEVGDPVCLNTETGYKLCKILSISHSRGCTDELMIGNHETGYVTMRYRKHLKFRDGIWRAD